MSFLAGGLKDLNDDDAPKPRRKATRKKKNDGQTKAPENAAVPTGAAPRGLGFDPLKQTERRNPTPVAADTATSSAHAPQGNTSVKQETEDLVANITALFSELGASTPAEESPETSDVTESLLHALNHTMEGEETDLGTMDDMNPEVVGKVLAENVMKQILTKNTLYEPLKDLKENYVLWLSSDAADGISPEERQRHQDLIASLEELIHVYDTDPDNIPRIMALFAKSQSLGSPPEAVYESLADYDACADDDSKGLSPCFQQ